MDQLQDIARSSYADMLHDDERNHAYHVAIKTVVKYLVTSEEQNPEEERHFKCCDIGAGSGLLSMMVAKSFLDLKYNKFHIDAYECFEPMSATAKEIMKLNNFTDFIHIHTERVGVKEKGENPEYDLLVAELLDTELIGEGCLEVYRFAIENLCSPQCIFIPQEARIYIEPIGSKGLFRRQFLRDQFIHDDATKREILFEPDKEMKSCCGLIELDDMQTSYLNDSFGFERITDPKVAFEIKFNNINSLQACDSNKLLFRAKKQLDQEIVIHLWWDIVMYDGGLFAKYGPLDSERKYSFSKLSNSPSWCRNQYQQERDNMIEKLYKRSIWREHWMQAIYYLPCQEAVRSLLGKREEGFEFDIYAYRDAYSLWFDLAPCRTVDKLPPSCSCGVHRRLNRYELSLLNGSPVLHDLIKALVQSSLQSPLQVGTERQNLKARLRVIDDSGEPNNKWRLDFWFQNDSEFTQVPRFSLADFSLTAEISWQVIMNRFIGGQDIRPIASFKIVYNQVAFHTLNRIRKRVGHCQGFDLSPLDKLIEHSSRLVDSSVEAHHLWEYSCEILGPEMVVFESEHQRPVAANKTAIASEQITLQLPDKPIEVLRSQWALVFSCNIKLTNGKIIKTGCLGGNEKGTRKWNHHFKQVVHFLHNHPLLESDERVKQIDLLLDITRYGISIRRKS